ncbi:hypothetical protein [Amycolatopsis sp. NPDC059657]|uniref:hypothetical protein n=1 Tax=Amycolatopsis sp. NPDC059657 TaxID=3346899 RepID=UPI0036702D00
MELTGCDLDGIPQRNLRVPVVEFARLWVAAEQAYDRDKTWTAYGVVETCRWLAGAQVRLSDGKTFLAYAPVTERIGLAYQEVIAAECLEAEKLLFRDPMPQYLRNRPGWLNAVVATLAWAWRCSGKPPIEVPAHVQG